jgi:murein DD-endopeptidase MepM/ murein hydrolase activator NlpD
MRRSKFGNRQWNVERLEPRRLLAADIEIIDVFLRDFRGNRVSSALIGERIEVVAQWTTRELPAGAKYDIRFRVNSYEMMIPSVTQGAGLANFSTSYAQIGWYALAGLNTMEVMIDSGSSIVESSENNNVRQQSFTATIPNPPTKFQWPLAGRLFEDFGISNDYDVEPSTKSLDYLGRTVYVDGHVGWDIGPGPFSANDNGLEVLATADGTIVWADDGVFDREIVTGSFATNGFMIDHGDGWTSLYVHMRRDSITVKNGDKVKAGQVLGLVGSSGNSNGPHLHFQVERNGRGVNLMIGREYYLASDVEDRFARASMKYLSISNRDVIGSDYVESISSSRVFLTNESKRVIQWFTVFGWKRPGPLTIAMYQPNGSTYFKYDYPMDYDAGLTTIGGWYTDFSSSAMPGRWNVKYSYAGTLIGEDFFEIASTGLPELLMRKDGNIVAESRWTPYDFASVAVGASPPVLRFNVENQGKADLLIQGLEVPSWISITKAPPSRLQPGATDYFEIAANTSVTGTRWAQVALLTNDPSEKRSSFQVQSTITASPSRSTRVGLFSQYASEGQIVLGKVYRSLPDDQPLVVDLSTGSAPDVLVPSSVTIPASNTWVSFPIQVLDDAAIESSERINIIATPRSAYSPSASELIVIDNDQVSGDVTLTLAANTVLENQKGVMGTVTRSGEIRDSLVINLFANDRNGFRLPLFVTIPAFKSSVDFQMTVIDDEVATGDHSIEIVAATFGRAASKTSLTIVDDEIATLGLVLNASAIAENGGVTTGKVTRNTLTSSPLVVSLSNSNSSTVNVPTTITIPAGSASASFTLRAIDNSIADGDRSATLTASANGFVSGTGLLTVIDDEVATFVLSLSANSVSENGGNVIGVVSRNTPLSSPLVVNLTSSDTTAATLPASVVIPAGETMASFTITPVNDSLADGNQKTTFTASALGFVSGTADFVVVDDETAILALSLLANSIPENNGTTIATVTRNTITNLPMIVNLSSNNTLAVSIPSNVTIPSGSSSTTFAVTAVNDAIATGNQTSTLSATAIGFIDGSARLTIVDDETATLTLSLSVSSITEKGGVAVGTVSRNTPTLTPLVVNLTSSGAVTIPNSVTIPSGASSVTFTVTAVDDTLAYGDRSATLNASVNGFTSGVSQLAILDDDLATLSLSLSVNSISENGGTSVGTVTRNTPTLAPLVVNLTNNITAVTIPSTVTIPAGAQSSTFTVTAVNDSIADENKVATLTASVADFVSAATQITVVDDEVATLALTLSSSSMLERNGTITAIINRNTSTDKPLLVNLTNSNSALANLPATLIIPSGSESATFTVTAINDAIAAGDQVATLTGSATGLLAGTAQLKIIDDDIPALYVSVSAEQISEAGGLTSVTVTRNTPVALPLTVNVSASNLSTLSLPLSLAIPSGADSAMFTALAINDAVADGNDLVKITADAISLLSGTAQITVIDDDIATLSLVLAAKAISEGGGTTFATVSRNTPLSEPLEVSLTSSDTSSVIVPNSVIIPSGVAATTFSVQSIDDSIADGNQKPTITVSANDLGSAFEQLTVVDDEQAELTISLSASSISESAGTLTGTVSRNTPPASDLIVNLVSSDLTVATVPSRITIPAGEFTMAFSINVINDSRYRGDSTVQIMASAEGLQDSSGGLLVTDDDPQWPWHNSRNPNDVNFDTVVSPLDALIVISFINSSRRGVLPDVNPGNLPPPYVDVNRDGQVTPVDALLVISQLNKQGKGEGEDTIQPENVQQALSDYSWLDSLFQETTSSKSVRDRRYYGRLA